MELAFLSKFSGLREGRKLMSLVNLKQRKKNFQGNCSFLTSSNRKRHRGKRDQTFERSKKDIDIMEILKNIGRGGLLSQVWAVYQLLSCCYDEIPWSKETQKKKSSFQLTFPEGQSIMAGGSRIRKLADHISSSNRKQKEKNSRKQGMAINP